MPAYDYDCAACGGRFEIVHGVHADQPTLCPLCGSGPIRKAISAPAIHYKGSGWAKKERHATPSSSGSKSTSEGTSGGDAGSKPGGEAPDAPSSPPTKATEVGAATTTD